MMITELIKKVKGTLVLAEFIALNPKKLVTALLVITTQSKGEFLRRLKRNYHIKNYGFYIDDLYQSWLKKNYPWGEELVRQKKIISQFKFRPKISLITPIFNTPEKFLRECIESVINQSYPNWELCLVDDKSDDETTRQIIKEYSVLDKRIKYKFGNKNGGISVASNTALVLTSGEYIGLLDHDDLLWPNALFEVVKVLNKDKKIEFIYSDEDKVSEDSLVHLDPFFKPDWNFDYLRSVNYIAHFAVMKTSLIKKIGGFKKEYDGAQDWDLFLRLTRELKDRKIFHIPTMLYSWRISNNSTASAKVATTVKKYITRSQQKALEDDLKKREAGQVLATNALGVWRVKYQVKGNPLISIIIPTKDKYQFIARCLESIIAKSTYKNYQLVIVDTGSSEEEVWDLYKEIKSKHHDMKTLKWQEQFNFSKVCNFGAQESSGDYLLFLNNDTEVMTPDWLESLLEQAQRQDIGAVGCKLLFPDNRIQHAGVVLGIKGAPAKYGIAGHIFKGFPNVNQANHMINSVRNYSAVTAACLMISRDKFNKVKGFDESFRIAYNDVDLCLKLNRMGFRTIYTPFSVLYHFESTSVGFPGQKDRDLSEFLKEGELMYHRWGKLLENDPCYNKNLTLTSEDFSIDPGSK